MSHSVGVAKNPFGWFLFFLFGNNGYIIIALMLICLKNIYFGLHALQNFSSKCHVGGG